MLKITDYKCGKLKDENGRSLIASYQLEPEVAKSVLTGLVTDSSKRQRIQKEEDVHTPFHFSVPERLAVDMARIELLEQVATRLLCSDNRLPLRVVFYCNRSLLRELRIIVRKKAADVTACRCNRLGCSCDFTVSCNSRKNEVVCANILGKRSALFEYLFIYDPLRFTKNDFGDNSFALPVFLS